MRSIISMRIAGFAFLVFLCNAGTALATGGMSCSADDTSIKLDVGSSMSHGMGGAFFQFKGELEVRHPKTPEDFRRFIFGIEDLTHHWIDGEEIKLLFYRERSGDKPHGFVELTVLTQRKDEAGDYEGRYELTLYDTAWSPVEPLKVTGNVTCLVE